MEKKDIMRTLENEVTRASQENQPLCIAMCEIDNIKKINDTYGKDAGEYIYRRVKQNIRSELRFFDTVTHSGKDEILLVFNCSEDNAKKIFERVRQSIADTPFYFQQFVIHITISCGLTIYTPPVDTRDTQVLIDTADKALFSAKDRGENEVVCLQA